MKKNDLIKQLKDINGNYKVCVLDLGQNEKEADEDGSKSGIYPVQSIELFPHPKPWISLQFEKENGLTDQRDQSYTGVDDKNGNPICEGDTVNCYDDSAGDLVWDLDKHNTGIIVWTPPRYSLKVGEVYLDKWDNAENIELITRAKPFL